MIAGKFSVALALLVSATATAHACTVPDGWRAMQFEHAQSSTVALKLPATPVRIGEPFAVDILVCTEQQPVSGNLKLDATMPAHKHGMNYRPEVRKVADNIFRGTGMFFHMPGQWQITVDLLSGDRVVRFTLKVPAR